MNARAGSRAPLPTVAPGSGRSLVGTIVLWVLALIMLGVGALASTVFDYCPPDSCDGWRPTVWLVSASITALIIFIVSLVWGLLRVVRGRRSWQIALGGLVGVTFAVVTGIVATAIAT